VSEPRASKLPDGAPRRSSAEPPFYTPLGPAADEEEGDHLRRVAAELGAADVPLVRRLEDVLRTGDTAARREAAAELGRRGSRDAIATLRALLEGPDPQGWEVAVHGLRQSREREGWLCLESVALECIPQLASPDGSVHRPAALRLLMMGRTKTMDRLFRAVDAHSRAIPAQAARRFVEAALASLPPVHAQVMSLRLGVREGRGHSTGSVLARTPPEVAAATGLSEERVRQLEAEAWAIVQSPRLWSDVSE